MYEISIAHFEIKRVVIGENVNYSGTEQFPKAHGVRMVNLRSRECAELFGQFIERNRSLEGGVV